MVPSRRRPDTRSFSSKRSGARNCASAPSRSSTIVWPVFRAVTEHPGGGGVGGQDDAVIGDRHDAMVDGVDDRLVGFRLQPVFEGEHAGACRDMPVLAGDGTDDEEYRQVEQQPGHADQGRLAVLGQGEIPGPGPDMGQPGMALELDRPVCLQRIRICPRGRPGVASAARIEQVFRRYRLAVIQFEFDIRLAGAEYAAHEIVHAKRAVDISLDGGPALRHRTGGRPVPIDGKVQQKPFLDVFFGLLDKRDDPGDCRAAGIARAFHGLAAIGLREHVETEGALVSPVERLEKYDRGVNVPRAGRANDVVGEPLGADTSGVGFQIAGSDDFGVAEALQPRIVFAQLKIFDVLAPFCPGYLRRRGEQADTAAQNLLLVVHSLADRRPEVGRLEVEAFLDALARILARYAPGEPGNDEGEAEHQPRFERMREDVVLVQVLHGVAWFCAGSPCRWRTDCISGLRRGVWPLIDAKSVLKGLPHWREPSHRRSVGPSRLADLQDDNVQ